jgi:hypothetical protein
MMRVRHRRRSDSGAVAGERFDARIPGLRAVTANFFLRYAAANLAKNTFFFCTHADGLYRRGGIAQRQSETFARDRGLCNGRLRDTDCG